MKLPYHLTITLLLTSFLTDRGLCQNINLNSISNARQAGGFNNGYTLDGQFMVDSRAKLLNQNNFGISGTYPNSINIIDGYVTSGSLTQISTIPTNQIFFFGAFDLLAPSTQQFTTAEIDSLYNWSKRGGKLIIGASAKYATGYDPSVLNSKWGFDIILNSPNSFVPTINGNNTDIFNGPFGTVFSANQGGGAQGYFNLMPTNSVVLAINGNGSPTLFMDCNTLDLIVADVDGFTSLGGISSGNTINNAQDKFWANTIVFMDQLENPPVIVRNEFELSTGTYNSYQWYLNGSPINAANNQSFNVSENGIYTVETTLKCGCKLMSDTVIIDNYENISSNYFLPNIFSPNGDGNNDVLYVRGKSIDIIAFFIYNRWGEKVFESHSIGDGWDGTFKGKPLNSAVFVFYIEVTFINGEHTTNKGNVTLIR